LTNTVDWVIILDAGVGLGVLLIGLGVFMAMRALAGTLGRLNGTLDEVDRQLSAIGVPATKTLAHIGGIADTADATVARLGGVVKSLEDVAGAAASTAALTKDAASPALVNVGAVLGGVTAGLRRLVGGAQTSPGDIR